MREVTIAYGMTETSPVSFQTGHRRPARAPRRHRRPRAAASRSEDRRRGGRASCRAAQPGELCTRGYSVMLGYWDDPETTAEAIDADGWMHTGDLGDHRRRGLRQHRRPHQGHGHPRRREHLSARDRGIPLSPSQDRGRAGGRRARREVSARSSAPGSSCAPARAPTTEEIRAFCRGQIAHYKIPRYVRFVDDFPMTVTGKIQKFVIREAMIAELNLTTQVTA